MKNDSRLRAVAILIVTTLVGICVVHAAHAAPLVFQAHEIADGWKVKSIPPQESLSEEILRDAMQPSEDDGWLAVPRMPATVPDVLLEHGQIEFPWLPGRAEQYRWIAERDWLYTVTFTASHPETASKLHFKGLDTIVDVYLNGQQVASHANMYWPLSVDVTGRLREKNELVLHFHSVFDSSDGTSRPLSQLKGNPARRVRRPQQNYGNYLGPQPFFSRVGVFDQVLLEVTDGSCMSEVVVDASLNESLTVGVVNVDVAGESRFSDVEIRTRLLNPRGETLAESRALSKLSEGKFAGRSVIEVHQPQLWWPRGYGDQPLYRVETTLMVQGRVHETITRTIGFRRVTMPQRLHFVINGVPVRLWGGDWVTPHWQTPVWDQRRVEKLFALAEHANFNAFRVWGVVESPRDDFYELADAHGFLLWQDFTDLPLAADETSRAICREEATQMIKRLKHHPSVIVWCGGNENAMWHFQEYDGQLRDRGDWPGLVAANEVGQICRQLDPARYYQPSSPYYGIDPNDPQEGNTHGYTNMWFVPGYDYLNFASEDTRIAAPVLHSLQRFMEPKDIWPDDYSPVYSHGTALPFPETWRRYTTGTSWKKTGPVELFYDATDAASLVHRLGMAEALYYQETIERQRRGRAATDTSQERRCGGYLAWKFNDSWPHIYSGKVDYFLEPYHAYYALRRAYSPVLLSFDKDAYIHLWAVNDSPVTVSGKVTIQLLHPGRNEVRKQIERDVSIGPGESQVVVRLDQAGIGAFRKEHVLYAKFTDVPGQVVATANCLGDIERRMLFPQAKLDVQVRDGELVITSDKFARTVTLEGDDEGDVFGWFFTDNYFDLMPGETKTVRILGEHQRGTVTAKAHYSQHVTHVEWQAGRQHSGLRGREQEVLSSALEVAANTTVVPGVWMIGDRIHGSKKWCSAASEDTLTEAAIKSTLRQGKRR